MGIRGKISVLIETHLLVHLRPMLSNHVYTIRRGPARGLKRKGGFAFIPEQVFPPTREERFLTGLDIKGKTVYDIGGYQGILTIFFARSVGTAGKIFAYEPNPLNYNRLMENVKLNNFDNVSARQLGIGKSQETLELAFNPGDPGRSSFRENYFANRNLYLEKTESIKVPLDSIDNQLEIHNLPKPDLVKIDVEEYEFDVLTGMKNTVERHKPALFIEMHGNSENVCNTVGLLHGYDYSVFNVEKDITIDPSNIHIVQGGDHLYCV